MTDVEDRLREELAREAARAQTATLRPLPAPGARAPSRPGRWLAPVGTAMSPGRRGARRWLAPAAAVVAVMAVAAGVSLAAAHTGSGPVSAAAPAAPAAAGMPPYYVSVTMQPKVAALVHDSRTGAVLSSVQLPRAYQGAGPIASIAAAANDRTFAIAAAEHLGHSELATRVLILRIGRGGHSARLGVLPLRVLPAASADHVDGLALSPDGTSLAVAVQVPTTGFHPYGEIEVAALTGSSGIRTWTTHQESGLPWDPVPEAGGRYLGFLWWGQTKGPATNFTAATQVRLLDTAASGRSLLASKVIATGHRSVGFLQDAFLSANGRSIIVMAYRNVSTGSGHGTAILKLAVLAVPGGQVTRAYRTLSVPYRGTSQEGAADSSCSVVSATDQGRHALVQCPRLARLDNGRLTPLPSLGSFPDAAW